MIDTKRLIFEMDGQVIPAKVILDWEFRRLRVSYNLLRHQQGVVFDPRMEKWFAQHEMAFIQNELVRVKLAMGMSDLRRVLRGRYEVGNAASVIAEKLSNGKRKFSITEIVVPNSQLTPAEVIARLNDVMMINDPAHFALNIGANPDHYVLQASSDDVQEVLEVTGGSPLPTHFYAHYGDASGLCSTLSAGYSAQLFGAARLKDGTIIGGVRHQVKKEASGFRFKAVVEFPSLLPDFMIHDHQIHLACEFGHWLTDIL
ncbi:hypothetical protein IV38_GL001526 [Lactobacillus selangorensis]|uniref:Uncharacterized protein n=1 Tax=Lactobacillus selangorensis TaxID=81857 RepID=A0A0R2FUA2_9LACO|nr:hypothetical protein [Lactobacillus selangorensis]KRN28076.1 hypothetical protein IV38_GL001526 [Lactobacillus selangorensis]KRN31046.1 hypothetical protein IV40_GL001689 [Lactobacillus selangorensis]